MKLTELFVKGEGDIFVAYKEHLWFLSYYEDDETFQDAMETLSQEIEDFEPPEDMFDFQGEISDDIWPNIVTGNIVNGEIHIYQSGNFRHSTASKTLLKVMDEVGTQKVVVHSTVYDEEGNDTDVSYEHTREEFLEPLAKKKFYHGTDLESAFNIIKKGLLPKPEKTNYKKIEHEDKVFMTLNPERADFHANTAAHNNSSIPCVLGMEIPDVNKLVLDYDVALEIYGTDHHQTMTLGYDDIMNYATDGQKGSYHAKIGNFVPKDEISQIRDKSSLNTKLGVFGYVGRIPAKFIHTIFVNEDNVREYIFLELAGLSISDNASEIEYGNYRKYTIPKFIQFYKDVYEEMEEEMREDEDEDED